MTIDEMNSKIDDILNKLTVDEKIKMIHGNGLFKTGEVKRLGIPSLKMSDGPMGVRTEMKNDEWIPIGNSDDFVTYCPSNSAIAATWNLDLAYECGCVIGEEARGRGKDIILAPGINIKRSPACGRNFEYMSEDPYLISQMVVPLIKGIQEADVAACVKHFALNNQETERLWVNVELSERAMREIYLPGFKAAVQEGGAYTLMGAYNLVRGQHCCESKLLLNQILREEWGYDGCVISDWGGVHHTMAAAQSGLDIEMSVTKNFDEYFMAAPLKEAIIEKKIAEEEINKKVKNIIRLMLRLKVFDEARKSGTYNSVMHRQKVLEVARESIVLLKNENHILPFKKENVKKLLIIGDNAERVHASGGGSAEIKALYEISPLLGLKMNLGGNCDITYARGYYVLPKQKSEVNWQADSINDNVDKIGMNDSQGKVNVQIENKRRELREEAVRLAKDADHVIIFGGLNHEYDVEGYDRDTMELPYEQDLLISEVLAVNPNAVIVMLAGNAVSMNKWSAAAKAIVWNYYAGMETGNALAEVLFGKVNPSGKLPETFPYKLKDTPAFVMGEYPGRRLTEEEKKYMDAQLTEEYKESILVGYRYYETKKIPTAFCFGHGLSYTTFDYNKVEVEDAGYRSVNVKCEITNTGGLAGSEIIQVYVTKIESSVDRPIMELKGFTKVMLQPHESRKIVIKLEESAFQYFDENEGGFVCEPGEYVISVGSSIKDIRETKKIVIR